MTKSMAAGVTPASAGAGNGSHLKPVAPGRELRIVHDALRTRRAPVSLCALETVLVPRCSPDANVSAKKPMATPRSLGANVSSETSRSPSSETSRATPFTWTVVINARGAGVLGRARVASRRDTPAIVPNQMSPPTRRKGAPDFIFRQPLGRRVPPRVSGSRIDLDDSTRRAKVEVPAGVLDHAPDVGAHEAGCNCCVVHQTASRRIVDAAHGAIHADDPEPAQAIDMKADDAERLASIEDGLEAAVAVREQACLSESKEQLTGWGLDDRRGARLPAAT